jgi:peptide/nickel transport system permease protein
MIPSPTLTEPIPAAGGARATLSGRGIRASLRRHPLEVAAGLSALLMVGLAVFGPMIATGDAYTVNFGSTLTAPSAAHWFGTDDAGRDVLLRVIYGARTTLSAVAVVLLIAASAGTLIGTVAAVGGRVADEILMRITDIGLSFPPLVLAIGLSAAFGGGLSGAVAAIALSWWPGYARLVRTLVGDTESRPFVENARVLGVSRLRLLVRHILPNALDLLFVQITLDISFVAVTLSGLSFVGAGARPPSAEWGAMIYEGTQIISSSWWVAVFPGLALTLTAISFSLLGDLLRSQLDPRVRSMVRMRRHRS